MTRAAFVWHVVHVMHVGSPAASLESSGRKRGTVVSHSVDSTPLFVLLQCTSLLSSVSSVFHDAAAAVRHPEGDASHGFPHQQASEWLHEDLRAERKRKGIGASHGALVACLLLCVLGIFWPIFCLVQVVKSDRLRRFMCWFWVLPFPFHPPDAIKSHNVPMVLLSKLAMRVLKCEVRRSNGVAAACQRWTIINTQRNVLASIALVM
jgi:hypothetical protein